MRVEDAPKAELKSATESGPPPSGNEGKGGGGEAVTTPVQDGVVDHPTPTQGPVDKTQDPIQTSPVAPREKLVTKPAAKPETAQPVSIASQRPRMRGNTPLPVRDASPVKGKERVRIPDEHDVVVDGEIVGRSPDPKERERLIEKHSRG